MRFFTLVLAVVCIYGFVFAREMVQDSEQFYVSTGMFEDLGIIAQACEQEDDVLNFACGFYAGSADQFQTDVDKHVSELLPGLSPTGSWFNNNGTTLVRAFQSESGSYLFAYNAGGKIFVVFTPF